jgi:hypothetical protein
MFVGPIKQRQIAVSASCASRARKRLSLFERQFLGKAGRDGTNEIDRWLSLVLR